LVPVPRRRRGPAVHSARSSGADNDRWTGGISEASTIDAFYGTAGRISLSIGGGITTVLLNLEGYRVADYRLRINGDVTAE